jgi:hypothetical protein
MKTPGTFLSATCRRGNGSPLCREGERCCPLCCEVYVILLENQKRGRETATDKLALPLALNLPSTSISSALCYTAHREEGFPEDRWTHFFKARWDRR